MELLVFAAAFSIGCYFIAKNNDREPVLAAILGFFFGIFALVGYLIAGKKKATVQQLSEVRSQLPPRPDQS